MSPERPPYPNPVEDTDNRPFLESWRGGILCLQRCRACGQTFFYPRPMCPHCWSDDLEWRQAAGFGKVVGYSKIYRANHPAFNGELPILLAEIRLQEGATLLARVIGDRIHSGAAVELLADGWGQMGLPLPAFRLMPGSADEGKGRQPRAEPGAGD